MSTLEGVNVEYDPKMDTYTASWAEDEGGAGVTVARSLVENNEAKNVVTGLVDDIYQEADGA